MMTSALARAATNGTDWTAVAAWAACATLAIYIVLGLFAWRQVSEARKLREEQARPFVIVDFEPGFLVYLTVENLGRTMAREISIRFDKPLESSLSGARELDESPLFREPIPTLPPGKKIRVLFDQFSGRMDAGLPLTYDVELRYRGPVGRSGVTCTGSTSACTSARNFLPEEFRSLSPRWRRSARRSRDGRAAASACTPSISDGRTGSRRAA
jgi:hypothetical protein